MSSTHTRPSVVVCWAGSFGLGLGIFWAAKSYVGVWWAMVYGLCWPTWLGFRLATYLLH
jgi:hypothetical protein